MKTELLIGCGKSRKKRMWIPADGEKWNNLVTLDHDESCDPDVWHDLEIIPYPFDSNTFDEIHAYEVLEHTGKQGDWRFFFAQFGELHRILKPNGKLFASVPAWDSVWAWGDPSHKRVISHASIVFLSQKAYEDQIGKTSMTDFRSIWEKDFEPIWTDKKGENFHFILQANK